MKRIVSGENPCFSPDGKRIAYDRGGVVYVRPFGAADLPDTLIREPGVEGYGPEKVVWSAVNITGEQVVELGEKGIPGGDARAAFIRVRARLNGDASNRDYVILEDAYMAQGMHLMSRRNLWFSTRIFAGRDFGTGVGGYDKAGEYVFTGVRVPEKIFVQVDGGEPYAAAQPRRLRLGDMRRIVVGRGLKEDVYGRLRLESARLDEPGLYRAECERRGLVFGIHTTVEENHWYHPLSSNWTLAHIQKRHVRLRNGGGVLSGGVVQLREVRAVGVRETDGAVRGRGRATAHSPRARAGRGREGHRAGVRGLQELHACRLRRDRGGD